MFQSVTFGYTQCPPEAKVVTIFFIQCQSRLESVILCNILNIQKQKGKNLLWME